MCVAVVHFSFYFDACVILYSAFPWKSNVVKPIWVTKILNYVTTLELIFQEIWIDSSIAFGRIYSVPGRKHLWEMENAKNWHYVTVLYGFRIIIVHYCEEYFCHLWPKRANILCCVPLLPSPLYWSIQSHAPFRWIHTISPHLAYPLIWKTEAADSSKILVPICGTTRCHIPEDSNLYSHCCENHRSDVHCCV